MTSRRCATETRIMMIRTRMATRRETPIRMRALVRSERDEEGASWREIETDRETQIQRGGSRERERERVRERERECERERERVRERERECERESARERVISSPSPSMVTAGHSVI